MVTKAKNFCKHKTVQAVVDVVNFTDRPGCAIDVRASCVECGADMKFVGPIGVSLEQPMVSPDMKEARLPAIWDD